MLEKWTVTLPRFTGDAPRTVYIYLPKAYEEEPERRYPVLYMFDGQNVFLDEEASYGESWRVGDYLDSENVPLIVVAPESDQTTANGRIMEYSPYSFRDKDFGYIRGRGRETMDWITQELKPQIDASFRTLPEREYTFLAGSSMGGLMAIYGVLFYNNVFSRAAALSPSVEVAEGRLENLIDKAKIRWDTVIYMDMGAEELHPYQRITRLFGETAARLIRKGAMLSTRIIPGGIHSETSWRRQVPFFMETLFYGLELPEEPHEEEDSEE